MVVATLALFGVAPNGAARPVLERNTSRAKAAQEDATPEDLQPLVGRFRRESSAEQRLALGRSVLARLAEAPDEALEAEVALGVGVALVSLERFAEARESLEAAQVLARRVEDRVSLAHALWELGLVAFHLGDFSAGIDWAAEGVDVAESLGRSDILWRCANVLGLIQERAGDYPAALDAFALALDVAEEARDAAGTAVVRGNLGIAQMNLGQYELAGESFRLARELERTAGHPSGLHSTVANLGDLSFLLGDYDEAYAYHLEALRLREKLGSEVELSLSYHSLGAIHYQRGEYGPALERFERSLELRRRLGLVPEQAATLAAMSGVYAALQENDKATQASQESLAITGELDMLGRRLGILQSLANVQEEQGDLAEALATHGEIWELEHQQRSAETRDQYAKFQAELDSKEKERRIVVLTKEGELQDLALRKQRSERNFLLAGVIGITLVALAGWAAWAALHRSHRALSVANAELEAASHRIKRLEGLLPICAHCKSIRDGSGMWHPLERYVTEHSEAHFSHGLCPICVGQYYSNVPPPLSLASEGGAVPAPPPASRNMPSDPRSKKE